MTKTKKLTLNKETFAILTNDEQAAMKGGATNSCRSVEVCPPTYGNGLGGGSSFDTKCEMAPYNICGGDGTGVTNYQCYPDDPY